MKTLTEVYLFMLLVIIPILVAIMLLFPHYETYTMKIVLTVFVALVWFMAIFVIPYYIIREFKTR